METRQCTKCGEVKPLDQFCKDTRRPSGRSSHCKHCHDVVYRPRKHPVFIGQQLLPDERKACSACGEVKPLSAFTPDPRGRTGYKSNCRECANVMAQTYKTRNRDAINVKRRRQYAENLDEMRAYHREKYWESRESHLATMRAYKESHADQLRQARLAEYAANREKYIERSKAFSRTYKGKLYNRLKASMRRAVQRQGDVTAEQIDALYKSQTECAYCGREFTPELPPTIDHIVPVSRGGVHTIGNIVLACWPCNRAKGNGSDSVDVIQQKRVRHLATTPPGYARIRPSAEQPQRVLAFP